VRAVGLAFVVASVVGCGAHRARTAGDATVPLESFIEQVREASLAAKPARKDAALTIEQRDPTLAAARLLLATAPTGENYRRVGVEYARLGVLDAAYDHYARAVRIDPRDAVALDGLARIWRDWGFPERGLGDVYRAIAFAPGSPAPHNTLGTMLVSLGQPAAAHAAFERALVLEPGAAYLLNNLCYVAMLEGDGTRAVMHCRAALDADPRMKAAHNNLALAFATLGDFTAASSEFLQSGDDVAERYNMGVAFLATHRYHDAAAAFEAAAALRPSLTLARRRAQQARDLAAAKSE